MAYEFGQQSPTWATGVASVLNPLAQAGAQVATVKMQTDLNVQRAKMGLPPIDYSANTGRTEEESNRDGPITREEGGALKPLLIVAGIAIVGFAVYKMTRK